MAKMKNLTDTTVSVQRWKFLPDGRCLDPRGNVKNVVPDDVAYGAAAKRLADQGVLDIEGYRPKKVIDSGPPVSVKETAPPDGYMRRKKKDKDE